MGGFFSKGPSTEELRQKQTRNTIQWVQGLGLLYGAYQFLSGNFVSGIFIAALCSKLDRVAALSYDAVLKNPEMAKFLYENPSSITLGVDSLVEKIQQYRR